MSNELEKATAYLNDTPRFARKSTLPDIQRYLERFGNPHEGMKIVHVAGTNGKGSVSAFIASCLREAGFSVGLFTSPHLVTIRERMLVDGEMIPEEAFIGYFNKVMRVYEEAKEEGLAVYTPGAGTEEVTVTDESAFRPMQLLLPLPPVMVVNKVTVHAWTGTDRFGPGTGGGRPEPMVYITETGHVIHHDPGCTYLRLTVHAVDGNTLTDRRNSSGERYHACERCSYHQAPGAVVYITDQGNRYHNLGSCSALRRTVRLVKESEAEGYHDCSRCGNK